MKPKHRRCLRPRHHVWGPLRITVSGWGVRDCLACGQVALA